MSEFHDPELRQQLGRLSGPYPDDNVAFAAWQRRVGQVRRRRAVAWTTAAAMSLVVGTVAVAAVQSPRNHSIVPGKSSETSAEVTLSVATTDDDDSSTTESTAAKTSTPVVLASDTTASSEVVETSMPETENTEAGGSSNGSGGSRSTPAPGGSLATQTFNSVGGSITVRQDGDRLTLVGVSAAAGFEADENRKSGGKVEVTFRSRNHRSQISVEVSDGIMDPSISENSDDDNETTTSADESDGDHGGNSGSGGNDND